MKDKLLPILAITVTTIECDGHDAAPCPNGTVVEFPHPQSVAIRLAKQSGWTVWMEATCPECVAADAVRTVHAPKAPAVRASVPPAGAPRGSVRGAEHTMLVPAGL